MPHRRRALIVCCMIASAVLPVAADAPPGQAGATAPTHLPWMLIAPTPPMGWNSWNKFGCDVSETLIKEVADALVSSGMKDAGYTYLVIDDCWQVSRDARGAIVPDAQRFPSGMKALADYVHAKGLKFGLYSDAGAKTCQGRPGSNGFEIEDARQYAAWGVDYLKYDWCANEGVDAKVAYTTMRDALRATGRPIVFSMCEWGTSSPWTWARGVAHLWRTTGDIVDCWECSRDWGGLGWVQILDKQAGLEKFAGPGGWNDPDMLEVGNGGLTIPESRAHFSFWALLAAPLMAGNDIRSMAAEVRDILTNKEVIAVNQDALGQQGRKVRDDGDREVWARKLTGDAVAVILFNRGKDAQAVAVSWQEIGLPHDATLKVRNLWTHQDLPSAAGTFSAQVPPHDVVMLRVAAR
jgi:alpha-galactosidase